MPSKSKHGKGKHPHRSKKSKAIQRQSAIRVRHDIEQTPETLIVTEKPTIARTSNIVEKTITTEYPFITYELRRIGILAGIILVILIVLAVILS
jgi:hypothetical protein